MVERNRTRRQQREEEQEQGTGLNWWLIGAGAVAAGAIGAISALAGVATANYLSRPRDYPEEPQGNSRNPVNQRQRASEQFPIAVPTEESRLAEGAGANPTEGSTVETTEESRAEPTEGSRAESTETSTAETTEGRKRESTDGSIECSVAGLITKGNEAKEKVATEQAQEHILSSGNQLPMSSKTSEALDSQGTTLEHSDLTTENKAMKDMVSRAEVPLNPVITDLNGLLHDIYVRYIAVKKEDCQLQCQVFDQVFQTLLLAMNSCDRYFERYSGTVQGIGSHYNNLRIIKPNEFEMDIVIGLPLCFENSIKHAQHDIVFEPALGSLFEIKMGTPYQIVSSRDGVDDLINRKPFEWRQNNSTSVMSPSRFRRWFLDVLQRGLNVIVSQYAIDGRLYKITKYDEFLTISDSWGFELKVRLVPLLKVHVNRWPVVEGYRVIPPACKHKYWMVAPLASSKWCLRFHLQEQERELVHHSQNLQKTIRLLMKLCDVQGMTLIDSYYINSLFLWEVDQQSESFWRNNIEVLFQHMLVKFRKALDEKKIPYYWNASCNLLEYVDQTTLEKYAKTLNELILLLEDSNRYREAAKFMLGPKELNEYRAIIDGV